MAGPMRDNSLDGSHRTKVADPRAVTAAKADTNFEYDDNEWDIGIGDLIIDLDADIEKTNEGGAVVASMASAADKGKLAVEHSATVDKGLKMKIKRTKPGTKTSEAKHEIVKSGEQQNGNGNGNGVSVVNMEKQISSAGVNTSAGVKRGSSGHRRDKARDKVEVVNGVVRPPVQRVVFPVTGPPNVPGPPANELPPAASPAPPPTTPPATAPPPPPTLEEPKSVPASPSDSPPPPLKKVKTCPSDISKESVDVCVGTSVGTITEPDCLGPCEPGTSVTLEGIVWHETEGVLVVNVTWRGKTYVGTLLDCTRHDWAPPRFCDSPTSDLDARTPKGRGKRGRQATGTATSNDLSNFTETRSSVHSKLRSNNNGGAKGRRNPGGPSSPTPFVPPKTDTTPGKRKPKPPEEETPAKKTKPPPTPPALTPVPTPPPPPPPPPVTTSSSPPPSPVLLECPEPNCSKKYKHINGLKYHQSHAHGNPDDEETKESNGSLSEAEEEPCPAPVIKKEEEPQAPAEVVAPKAPTPQPMEVPISPPSQQPPKPPTPTPAPILEVEPPPAPATPEKSIVKPGVLRFAAQEEPVLSIPTVPQTNRPVQTTTPLQLSPPRQSSPIPNNQQPMQLVIQPQLQQQTVGPHVVQLAQSLVQQNPAINSKVPQFKVKPTSVLMPDDKKVAKPTSHKKKRKSPAGSPHPHPHLLEPQPLGLEPGGREDVQSPAYSDISDDGAPVLDPEVDCSKSKPRTGDKKGEVNPGQSPHSMQHYNMYPYYGQPPYLVPSVTPSDNKPKDNTSDKSLEAKLCLEKELKKEGSGEFQQKIISQHYYPYGYVPGYPYNLEPNYSVPMVAEEKAPVIKEEKSPVPMEIVKQNLPPAPTTLHVPNPNKIKTEPGTKEKHPNENHQILKESIEMKNQMSPAYMYSRPQQQQGQSVQQQDEMRRYYIYPERRKEHPGQPENPPLLKATPPPQPKQSAPVPSPKHKDRSGMEEKKEERVKQEGVKPTMETQGPPPPPTSSYAYIHPGYMQSPHYGAIPFDPGHPMYARGINPMIVPSPYQNNPYIHAQLHPPMPRYHAPEDLSRPPTGGPKALDLLQHHANQYYTSHKIHELQERALKSPTPKAANTSSSPSAERGQSVGTIQGPQGPPTSTNPSQPPPSSGKPPLSDSKDTRSPPPQRHVHTHHHTHVGLGYPIITGQYPASYGAAVLASQQAAAVAASASVVSPFSPK